METSALSPGSDFKLKGEYRYNLGSPVHLLDVSSAHARSLMRIDFREDVSNLQLVLSIDPDAGLMSHHSSLSNAFGV